MIRRLLLGFAMTMFLSLWVDPGGLAACPSYTKIDSASTTTRLLECLAKGIIPKLKSETGSLDSGRIRLTTSSTLCGFSTTVPEDYAVGITLEYDPKPVGGILVITAHLLPAFPGVGGAARPLLKESGAIVVDRVTVDMFEPFARMLIGRLGRDYDLDSTMKKP